MTQKILVIGIDAMSPRITGKLVEQGKLPNFASLHYRTLQTTIPPETPVAWSAAATGVNPGKYGIFDFIGRNTENYLPRLCLADEKPGLIKTEYVSAMKGTPFWEYLNQKDIPTTVVRWPVTFPAKKIKGRMLSGLGVVDIRGSLNSYSFYTDNQAFLEGEGKEKVTSVELHNGKIETVLKGPLVRKRGKLRSIEVPLHIELNDTGATIKVDGVEYSITRGKWSEMMRAKFNVLPFHDIYGIFNAYLDPDQSSFKLYISSVQIDPENPAQSIAHPKEYGDELVEQFGLFQTLGMPEETKAVTEGKLSLEAFIEQIKELEAQREEHFFYELKRFEQGALAFIFDSGDRLKHLVWETVAEQGDFDIPKAIEDYYLQKDQMLGKVLEQIDENTKLIILSDHGFHNFTREVHLNSLLIKEGFQTIQDSPESQDLFAYVDWSKTKAYALGFTSVFLNLKGREKKGIIEPNDRAAIVEELIALLKGCKDGDNDVFTEVYDGHKIYQGPYVEALAPDIVVGFAPGYRMSWKSAIGNFSDEIIVDNEGQWCGDHLIDRSHVPGVLFTNFPVEKLEPEIIDVAPTILKLSGVAIPPDIDGEALV